MFIYFFTFSRRDNSLALTYQNGPTKAKNSYATLPKHGSVALTVVHLGCCRMVGGINLTAFS
jgi:hypothetical protein